MRKYLFHPVLIAALVALSVCPSCDRDPVPPPEPVVERMTIADLRELFTGSTTKIDTNVYIKGVVTLTPELGNLPGFIAYIQDETGGMALTVSGTNSFAMGSEVKIKCRGIELSMYRGLMQFGNIDIASVVEVVTLNAVMPQPREATLSEILAGSHEGVYVKLNDVEFSTTGTLSGSKALTDCSNSVTVHTRSEAQFASQAMPAGNGIFRGVVSVFDTPQLIMRDPAELNMTEPRKCNIPKFEWLKEDFESVAEFAPIDNLAGWKNINQAGSRNWVVRYFSSDTKYAYNNAFNSNMPEVIAWMITPSVDLTGASNPILTFRTKGAHANGATLETLVSTDYDGGNEPWNFTWTTLPATYPAVPTSGFGNWGNSGELSLSSYKTMLYVAFRYTGADPAGTANDKTGIWQVDDIRIGEK